MYWGDILPFDEDKNSFTLNEDLLNELEEYNINIQHNILPKFQMIEVTLRENHNITINQLIDEYKEYCGDLMKKFK